MQDTLTASTEVAIVIGFLSCVGLNTPTCPPPSATIGNVLYNGPYDPEFHNNGSLPNKPPYQNFTVTIPASAPAGPAQLSLTHLSLVGVSPPRFRNFEPSVLICVQLSLSPFLEFRNITLNVN